VCTLKNLMLVSWFPWQNHYAFCKAGPIVFDLKCMKSIVVVSLKKELELCCWSHSASSDLILVHGPVGHQAFEVEGTIRVTRLMQDFF
jgi:hypothetical protein